jgi:esterase/lipase superfamily enzyme
MTEQELLNLLIQCNPAQLDAITVKLGLNRAYLLGREAAPASRASDMLKLITQPGGPGLAALETVLAEIFGSPKPHEGNHIQPTQQSKCILILAANPINTERLRLDEEIRTIKERLNEGQPGQRYRVESEWAVRDTDLSKYLLQYNPSIVHFSGHGSPTGEIILEDETGNARVVSARALADLFGILKGSTECVVLNACYSLEQAKLLAKSVGCVAGMTREIGDRSALRFAAGFYRGLAFGRDYVQAFQLGCNEIDLASLPDAVVPHFTTKEEDRVAEKVLNVPVTSPSVGIELVSPKRTWVPLQKQPFPQEDENAPRLYPLWYGTNRQPVDPNDPAKGYSAERDSHHVYYGICKVGVPKSHKIGSLGSSWLKRFLTWTDDRLKLVELLSANEANFWGSVRDALMKWDSGERMALVFIHGYNVSFEGAALRAAQIGVDLKVPGITAFFSWPSKGNPIHYAADKAAIEASETQITGFLTRFTTDTGAERVHLIAHSMGNHALLRSLQRIAQQAAQTTQVPFAQIFLAAPDVDVDVFCNLAEAYRQLAQRMTLYVSSKDKALASSGLLHDFPRAGYTPPVTVLQGIDTIEVSNIDLSFLGHGYYAAARDLLRDMHDVVLHNSPPDSRWGLDKTSTAGGQNYWRIGA